jgi:hypothetical protein
LSQHPVAHLHHQKTKWAIFTYSGKKTEKVTNFLEKQINLAFRKMECNRIQGKRSPRNRQVRKKWRVPNEMYGFLTKAHGADGSNIVY